MKKKYTKKYAMLTLLLLTLNSLLLNSCSDESTSLSFPSSEIKMISFQRFEIPQFPTARGQLNYAKSGFPDPEEKKAAFEIIAHLFPDAKIECGNAALYLSYLNLGFDYRFAKKENCYSATKAYQGVINNYKGYPEIIVKAFWYLGWIHCDLLKEKEIGTGFYWNIVEKFPDFEIGISSPVPWVSLVYPLATREVQPAKAKAKKQWASIALLEIIRHSNNKTEVDKAFDALWKKYRTTVPTGLAIKLMLQNKKYTKKALLYVDKYLALDIANSYLTQEIKQSVKE